MEVKKVKFRPYQKETVERAVRAFTEEGYRNVIIEAPTGFGKSLVNYLIVKNLGVTAWYTTPQVVLLEQLERDPLISIPILKGRDKYMCLVKNVPADIAPCATIRGYSCPYVDECPYFRDRDAVLSSDISGISFAMLIKTHRNEKFGKRTVLIVDEADDIEDWGAEFGRIEFRTPLSFGSIHEIIRWAEKKLQRVEAEIRFLEDMEYLTVAEAMRLRDLRSLRDKIEFFLADAKKRPHNWAFRKRGDKLILQVIDVGYVLDRFVWSRGEYRIISSATIIDAKQFAKYTGLSGRTLWIRIPHPFPKEIRPIIYRPVAKMTKNARDSSAYDAVVQEVVRIAKKHEFEKGIIHAHSYEIAQEIAKRLQPKGWFVITHGPGDRDRKFNLFLRAPKNTIFVSVGFSRGIDLKYDLARWQVILKLPFPDQSNIRVQELWVKRRAWKWARYQTIKTLVQTCGRIVRAEDDYGVTYILDKSFEYLIRYKKEFPPWFLEAIIVEGGSENSNDT